VLLQSFDHRIFSTKYLKNTVIGMQVSEKTNVIKKLRDAGKSFGHKSCCYIFMNLAEDKDTGKNQIYIGQTRYIDSRLQSYVRIRDTYKNGYLFLLIKDDNESGDNFDEAWIHHLEYLFIDHFKNMCWGTSWLIENKQSGTPSVSCPSISKDVETAFDAFKKTLEKDFSIPLNKSTTKIPRRLKSFTAKHDGKSKRYEINVLFDEDSKLIKVEKGSIAVASDRGSKYHHKVIHRKLESEGHFYPITTPKPPNYSLDKSWIAMNFAEVTGAMANGPGPLKWYDDNQNLVTKAEMKSMR
jgi:hypothetical protein